MPDTNHTPDAVMNIFKANRFFRTTDFNYLPDRVLAVQHPAQAPTAEELAIINRFAGTAGPTNPNTIPLLFASTRTALEDFFPAGATTTPELHEDHADEAAALAEKLCSLLHDHADACSLLAETVITCDVDGCTRFYRLRIPICPTTDNLHPAFLTTLNDLARIDAAQSGWAISPTDTYCGGHNRSSAGLTL